MSEFVYSLNSNICDGLDVYLLAVVMSKASNFENRRAIRETWGLYFRRNPELKLVFLVGLADNVTNDMIRQEREAHGDVVQTSVWDSYRNLPFKSVSMLQWQIQYCPNTQFLLKIDDDVYIHVPRVLFRLYKLRNEFRFILGKIGFQESPIREPSDKSYVSLSEYPFDQLPMFVHGPSYVISGDLVKDLYNISRHMPKIHLEDVYITGLCAMLAGAKLIGHCGFSSTHRLTVTWFLGKSTVTGHNNSPTDLRELWAILKEQNTEQV